MTQQQSDSTAPASEERLSVVRRLPVSPPQLPVSSSRERWREPLFQARAAALVAALSAAAGAVAQQWGRPLLAATALTIMAAGAMMLTLVLAQAFLRSKLIELWSDRRALRVGLQRLDAERRLLVATMEQIHAWRQEARPEAQPALARLVDGAQAALAARHDDVAVLLVIERDHRWTVSHIARSAGSRWSYLHAEKWCPIGRQTAEERLCQLAAHPRSFPVAIPGGRLLLAVLCDEPLAARRCGEEPTVPESSDPLAELQLCFELLAAQWQRRPPAAVKPLRSVI